MSTTQLSKQICTVNSWYLKLWFLKVPPYIKEYCLDFPIFIYISTPLISNYWYLKATSYIKE